MMMVAARGDERGLCAEALHELEAKHAAVEPEGTVKVGYLQVHMADADAGSEGRRSGVRHGCSMAQGSNIAKPHAPAAPAPDKFSPNRTSLPLPWTTSPGKGLKCGRP
jgi:hypothetical protein